MVTHRNFLLGEGQKKGDTGARHRSKGGLIAW